MNLMDALILAEVLNLPQRGTTIRWIDQSETRQIGVASRICRPDGNPATPDDDVLDLALEITRDTAPYMLPVRACMDLYRIGALPLRRTEKEMPREHSDH